MLRYFKINDPYRLLALMALLVLLFLVFFIDPVSLTHIELNGLILGEKIKTGFSPYTQIIDSVGPLTGWLYGFCSLLFGDSLTARHIFSLLIIFIQTVVFGLILIDKKVFPESTYIPSVIFGILFLFSFDSLSLTGDLVGVLFLILALNNVYRELEFREQGNENVFKIGLYIGIASLFSFSFGVYVFASLIILGLFSRATTPKFFLVIVAFLMPHLLLFSVYFINNGVTELWRYYYLPNLMWGGADYLSFKNLLILGAIPFCFLIISFVILTRDSHFTKYQSQLFQAMFFWLIFSVLQIWYSKDLRPQSLITLFPSLSFFISYFFLTIRRKRLAEIAFWVFLLGIASVNYLTRYNIIESVNYNALFVSGQKANYPTGKRILILNENTELYNNNIASTPFFNWKLSQPIFEEPEYYENIVTVYNGFKLDPPQLIIDSTGLMDPFFERIPELKRQYKKSPGGYMKISN